MRTCRICGCDDDHACMTPSGPCYWAAIDLCSAFRDQLQETEEHPLALAGRKADQ
jgi:hypothetical protein